MVLSILGTVMLIIGGLGSFAGACPMSCLFSKHLFGNPDPLPRSYNSTLRPRDRSFPYRNGIFDWGTSGFIFCWITHVHAHAVKILCANENSSASS